MVGHLGEGPEEGEGKQLRMDSFIYAKGGDGDSIITKEEGDGGKDLQEA